MKILRAIASIDPGVGGPASTVRAITPALERLGIETAFVTMESAAAKPFSADVETFAIGPGRSRYGYNAQLRPWLSRNLERYDAIIVHGLWEAFGPAVRAASRAPGAPPYFVVPHGMLDPAIRRTYPLKHFKKWIYWHFAERRVLRDARAVFYSSITEQERAQKTFLHYQANACVIPVGAARPEGLPSDWAAAWQSACPSAAKHRYFLHLGPIQPGRGLKRLLRAYARVARNYPLSHAGTAPDLVIAGVAVSQRYQQKLHALADAEGITNAVHWLGPLAGDVRWGALSGAEAFVQPSEQENFGASVIESLACGRPVLISDRFALWKELDADNAAFVEAASLEGTARLLERWLSLGPDARNKMADASRACFEKHFEIDRAARRFRDELFRLLDTRSSKAV